MWKISQKIAFSHIFFDILGPRVLFALYTPHEKPLAPRVHFNLLSYITISSDVRQLKCNHLYLNYTHPPNLRGSPWFNVYCLQKAADTPGQQICLRIWFWWFCLWLQAVMAEKRVCAIHNCQIGGLETEIPESWFYESSIWVIGLWVMVASFY